MGTAKASIGINKLNTVDCLNAPSIAIILNIYPIKFAPESPINTLAGYLLKIKNPPIEDANIIEFNADISCFNIKADKKNVIAETNDIPPANPSIPSDQFITVVTPKIQIIVTKN